VLGPGREGLKRVREEVRRIALEAKGFLDEAEGMRLYELAAVASLSGPCLEIGSYCGKSTLFLGEGCREAGRHPLFTVDHHRGSEEQQPGEAYFDPDLYDAEEGGMTTHQWLMRAIRRAGLEDWIIPVIAESTRLGRYWPSPALSLVFIDGGHTEAAAFGDYHTWSHRIRTGGYLCIHDVFPDPADGGRAPYLLLQHARSTDRWDDVGMVKTLAVLRRR
jgi:MMP 1-O-methyltransferase